MQKKEKIPPSQRRDLLLRNTGTLSTPVPLDGNIGYQRTSAITMIRRIALFCNIEKIGEPSERLYTYTNADLPDLSGEHCPACGAKGMFKKHGSYRRYVVDRRKGKNVVLHLSISRVKCACGCTHALLKDTMIPYCQYSLRFILQVLRTYFRHSRTVAQICADFQIAAPTLYRWKKIFLSHRELWLGLLRSREQDPCAFLCFLSHHHALSGFLQPFFLKTAFSFLQSHANPAYS